MSDAVSTELPPMRHKAFSGGRIGAIASNTLLELVRLKVFYFLLLFALITIGSSLFFVTLTFQEQFQMLKDFMLGSMSIFSWLLAVLATAMLLPKDIEDRTLYTILAKPVPRLEYLLGKFLGVLSMLAVAVGIMAVLVAGVLAYEENTAIAGVMQQYHPHAPGLTEEQSREMQQSQNAELMRIRAGAFNWSLGAAIVSIYLKAALCASLTLFLSTFATSWIFTIMMSITAYFIGHLQALARESWLQQQTGTVLTKAFLALVALLFPDLQLFSLVDDVAAGAVIPAMLFWKMFGLGVTYTMIYLLAAYFMFAVREL
jgi:hypothetical protein